MLSIKVGKSLIWCLFPINVFESKLNGSVFRVICRPYTEMIYDYFNWGYVTQDNQNKIKITIKIKDMT